MVPFTTCPHISPWQVHNTEPGLPLQPQHFTLVVSVPLKSSAARGDLPGVHKTPLPHQQHEGMTVFHRALVFMSRREVGGKKKHSLKRMMSLLLLRKIVLLETLRFSRALFVLILKL